MERLDKIISSRSQYSRKEVKDLINKKRILINGQIALKCDMKIEENNAEILIEGKRINLKKYIYLILNKPKGYISATEDEKQATVIDLIPNEFKGRGIFPAGRLDKDTTGLMFLTNDGEMSHNILSPRKHVKKIYEVTTDIDMNEKMVEGFEKGIELNDGKCMSAVLKIIDKNFGIVIIRQGRYHQIKRMFGCFGAKVIELNRIGIGNLELPVDLQVGQCRELSEEELGLIQEKI